MVDVDNPRSTFNQRGSLHKRSNQHLLDDGDLVYKIQNDSKFQDCQQIDFNPFYSPGKVESNGNHGDESMPDLSDPYDDPENNPSPMNHPIIQSPFLSPMTEKSPFSNQKHRAARIKNLDRSQDTLELSKSPTPVLGLAEQDLKMSEQYNFESIYEHLGRENIFKEPETEPDMDQYPPCALNNYNSPNYTKMSQSPITHETHSSSKPSNFSK